ncbi:MAG: shikimate kinase [Planctomycetes bacterium]|nr:shikimate kinase [Planctomycetota bacterium]
MGYRGSGKSSVGRLLADRLGWGFRDTDRIVEELAGKTIARCFAEDGEPAFRDLESDALRRVAAHAGGGERLVVATGGGIVLREENVALLRRTGAVVWLTASPAVLGERIGADRASAASRPALAPGGSSAGEVERVLRAREPLYRSAAHVEVSAEGRSPEGVLEAILLLLRERGFLGRQESKA